MEFMIDQPNVEMRRQPRALALPVPPIAGAARALLWALVLQLVAGAAFAADAAGNYAIWGVGRSSCHQFVESLSATSGERYRIYLTGYLTAFNTLREDTYNATGGQSLDLSVGWLADYCELHQMESFDRAIKQMLSSQFESRQQVPPGRERGWGRPAADPE
jgi:hypothetical protein